MYGILCIAPLVAYGIWTAIAALIGGASAYASSRAQAKTAARNTDATNAANLKMSEFAYSKDLEMWNKGNEYNSPEAQMLRLRGAGLNPNMVYGNGAVGNSAGQLPKYNAPTQEFNYAPDTALASAGQTLPDMLGRFQDFQMRQAQIDNVKAQTNATQANSVNTIMNRAFIEARGKYAPRLEYGRSERMLTAMDLERATSPYSLSVLQENARSGERRNILMDQEISRGPWRKSLLNEDLIFKRFQNEWMKAGVSGRDSIFMRMLVREFPNLFSGIAGHFK